MNGRRDDDPMVTGQRREVAPPEADTGAPAPGDLFVVREVAEFPLEWAVIARDDRDAGLLLVVPADAHPATGSPDVRVPPRSSAGPLSLRCRYRIWVPAGFLAANVPSGRLEPADLSRAKQRIDEIEHDGSPSDPLGRETDRDPEYQDWIAETVAPAAEALEAAARSARTSRPPNLMPAPPTSTRPRRPLPLSTLAAAALLLVALGLSWRTVSLQRKVERLSRPLFDAPFGEVMLGGGTRTPDRSPVKVRISRGASYLLLTVLLGPDLPANAAGHLEIHDSSDRSLWSSPLFSFAPARELHLVLPRDLLPEHAYKLALCRQGLSAPLEQRALELETGP
jgi:hypothetical protein